MGTVLLYTLGVVLFLAAIMVSIGLHELGHLHFAKKYGCRVSEYMIGFGPRVFSFTHGETEYGLKLIPLGGYVKIIGIFPPKVDTAAGTAEVDEDGNTVATLRKSNTGMFAQMVSQTRATEQELIQPSDKDRLFYKRPWNQKVMTMLAGPMVNIVLAFVCLLGVYSTHGIPSIEPTGSTVIDHVSDCVIPASAERTTCTDDDPTSPAAAAGLQVGDEIVSVNGEPVSQWAELERLIHRNGSDMLRLQVIRDGEKISLDPVSTVAMSRDLPDDSSSEPVRVGFLGVSPVSEQVIDHRGVWFTFERMGEMVAHAVTSVVALPADIWNVAAATVGVAERDEDGLVSIVGGSRLAGEMASTDLDGIDAGDKVAMLTLLAGSFNLFIGVFNLIPLLPLDGGHIAGAVFEQLRRLRAKLFRRPDPGYADVARQLPIAYCLGFALVTMSMVLIVGDIVVPVSTPL